MTVKKTAFNEIHASIGGKLVEFAGFEMPVQYSGIIQEHLAVRTRVGVFDVSHMGELEVRGNDALSFLQRMTINDVSKLTEGRAQYSGLCYDDGVIVDDLLVYHRGTSFMLVVNAANTQKDFEWLRSHLKGNVELNDVSDAVSLLAVQGPHSLLTLQKLTAIDLKSIEYYHHVRGKLAGIDMLISRTGYTGELGYELYFEARNDLARTVWSAIFDAGQEFGILPVGLGARDTLRLEMGYCLYGNDIDQTTNHLEAGLGWITKLNKGDFVGRNALLKVKEEGVRRKLMGFTLSEKAVARHGYPLSIDGTEVGLVTSGTFSPSLEQAIGMGYVAAEHAKVGGKVTVGIRGRQVPASLVKVPFVQKP